VGGGGGGVCLCGCGVGIEWGVVCVVGWVVLVCRGGGFFGGGLLGFCLVCVCVGSNLRTGQMPAKFEKRIGRGKGLSTVDYEVFCYNKEGKGSPQPKKGKTTPNVSQIPGGGKVFRIGEKELRLHRTRESLSFHQV